MNDLIIMSIIPQPIIPFVFVPTSITITLLCGHLIITEVSFDVVPKSSWALEAIVHSTVAVQKVLHTY